jgi:hypothetical protein
MKSILKITVVLLTVACVVESLMLYRAYKDKAPIMASFEQLKEAFSNAKLAESSRRLEMDLNGKNMDGLSEITDGKGVRIELNEIMDANKLVLYFSESNCGECVKAELEKLDKWSDSIGVNNIIIFIDAVSMRYVAQYKANNKSKFHIYEIEIKQKNLFPTLFPIYFILEKETKRVNVAFVPRREYPEETYQYLDQITKDYFYDTYLMAKPKS